MCRTKIDDFLWPLDEVIDQHFIPAITGRPPCPPSERKLLALPPRLGGLGLSNPFSNSQSSKQVTTSLVALIVVQNLNGSATEEPKRTKVSIRKAKWEKQLTDTHEIKQQLTQQQKRLMECATEKQLLVYACRYIHTKDSSTMWAIHGLVVLCSWIIDWQKCVVYHVLSYSCNSTGWCDSQSEARCLTLAITVYYIYPSVSSLLP